MRLRRRAFRLSQAARVVLLSRPPSVALRQHSAPWSGCSVMSCGVRFDRRAFVFVCRHRIEQLQRRVSSRRGCGPVAAARCACRCCRCVRSPPRTADRSAWLHSDRVSPSIRASSCNVTARPIARAVQRSAATAPRERPAHATKRTDKKKGDEPTTRQQQQHRETSTCNSRGKRIGKFL